MVSAVRADELVVGDVTVWNYGSRYRVDKAEKVSAHFVAFTLVEVKFVQGVDVDGSAWVKRMKADRLVAFSDRARATARRADAMKAAAVNAGDRVSYRNVAAVASTFSGVVVDRACGDITCGLVHVECDSGQFHHVDVESIARASRVA